MAPSDYSTMAYCEPVPDMRDRIAADLRIKGQYSCPQQIEMRAIIPVYDFSRAVNRTPGLYRDIDIALAGQPSAQLILLPTNIVNYLDLIIRSLYLAILFDAAGRAAIVAATNGIVIELGVQQYDDFDTGTVNIIGRSVIYPGTLAATECRLHWGIGEENLGLVTQRNPAPQLRYLPPVNGLICVNNKYRFVLTIYLSLGGNFPANTTGNITMLCDYIGEPIPVQPLP
jgi:hypothetical protein